MADPKNFRTRGLIFLDMEIVLVPLHTYPHILCYISESREFNTHCKHCMLIIIKFMHVMLSKFLKINLKKFQSGGHAPGARALDLPLPTPSPNIFFTIFTDCRISLRLHVQYLISTDLLLHDFQHELTQYTCLFTRQSGAELWGAHGR